MQVLELQEEPDNRGSAILELQGTDDKALARFHREIIGANGQPVRTLADWRLQYIDGPLAVFRSGDRQAVLASPAGDKLKCQMVELAE